MRQRELNKALDEQRGGRVVFQQRGLELRDAYRTCLDEARARGDFTITRAPLESEFRRYYRDDSIHSFLTPGSPEATRVFAVPPWGSPVPGTGSRSDFG